MFRSSCSEVFFEKSVLKNFTKFQEESEFCEILKITHFTEHLQTAPDLKVCLLKRYSERYLEITEYNKREIRLHLAWDCCSCLQSKCLLNININQSFTADRIFSIFCSMGDSFILCTIETISYQEYYVNCLEKLKIQGS